jgi:hypothetical protein
MKIIKENIFKILSIAFAILTILGAIYIFNINGYTSPGFTIIPMIFSLIFNMLDRNFNKTNHKTGDNKSIILTILLILSVLPMLLNQFGSARGVQEISGLLILFNPLTILSIITFILSVWFPTNNKKSYFLGLGALITIVLVEIYEFFTWFCYSIGGDISLKTSLLRVYPEFYFGLSVSILMIICFVALHSKIFKNILTIQK